MNVIWSARAGSDLTSIIAYIEDFDDEAAHRVASRLRKAARSLEDFPKRGRPVGRGLRQLSTVYPYAIRYRVHPNGVEIVSVRHGARR